MSANQIQFGSMMKMLAPYLITFVVAGFFMVTGFMMVLYPLLKNQIACYFSSEKKINSLPSKKIKVAVSFEM